MSIIIHDFEVFKHDTLLGAIVVDGNSETIFQTWDEDEMRNFYEAHINDLWVGHNNISYDEIVLEAIVKHKNAYKASKSVINSRIRPKCTLPIKMHDSMRGFYSLKMTELAVGKNISETQVDFDLDRPLTEDEKLLTESYNRDDLNQTLYNFKNQLDEFNIRLTIINTYHLPASSLTASGTKIAAMVLGAKAIPGIENMKVETKLPSTIQLKNQDVIDFYLNEDFRKNKKIKVKLCGCEHIIASGGIHAALKKIHVDRALYFDVSGYYNLIMINYGLLPRTMPQEAKDLYVFMYHEQLRLKKINPQMRSVYKTILLSVFGAMMNEYTDFYDPYHGSLVTITGEIFLVDLLEKLEGHVRVLQSNTDGIMVEPLDWSKKDEVIKIVEEWENRTGFVIKKEEIYNLWQRDVNNYVFDQDGEPHAKGEIVNAYNKVSNPVWCQSWNCKEAPIIAKGIVDYLVYGITPEETVENNKKNLLYFQYPCKALSFDYCMYEKTNNLTGEVEKTRLQNVNRAFAAIPSETTGMVVKYKHLDDGTIKKAKVASLPSSVFVYNDEILSDKTVDKLTKEIYYQAYVDRIYQRLGEFI